MGLVAPEIDLTFFGGQCRFFSAVGFSDVRADKDLFSASRTDNFDNGLRGQRCTSRRRASAGNAILRPSLSVNRFVEQFLPRTGRRFTLIQTPKAVCGNWYSRHHNRADQQSNTHLAHSFTTGAIN